MVQNLVNYLIENGNFFLLLGVTSFFCAFICYKISNKKIVRKFYIGIMILSFIADLFVLLCTKIDVNLLSAMATRVCKIINIKPLFVILTSMVNILNLFIVMIGLCVLLMLVRFNYFLYKIVIYFASLSKKRLKTHSMKMITKNKLLKILNYYHFSHKYLVMNC